ncbi:coiled-coil domain-containing protein 18 [Plakobranchus ocellatus]|uniref:Coiled-coil domain-containing protein 18 n=1 Tax=Plakobranchus ocellatus TaxID=259542 RepID=A0AAV4B9L8_9GAST|nr:coiled-coil domain-containing protein 18 [Plakobranchus ocellatus]
MSFIVPSSAQGSSSTVSVTTKEAIKHNKLEFEEMRKKLLITEQRLRNLSRLEDEVQSVVSTTSTLSCWDMRSSSYHPPASQQSDVESAPSAIGTVPNSYSGFEQFKVPSSTPSKKRHHFSGKAHSLEDDSIDSDPDSLTCSSLKENDPGGGRGGGGGLLRENGPDQTSRHERKLLKQNQRLLCEVERLVGEVHQAKQQVVKLEHLVEPARRVPELEDKLEGSLAESIAQEKALREAEQHLELGAKRNSELQKKVEQLEAETTDIKQELEQVRAKKRDIECQRDEALQNLIEAQDSLEDYQRRSKEKIRKMEAIEDELRDTLSTTRQEKEDLMEQLSDVQTSLSSQEAQINRLLKDVERENTKRVDMENEKKELEEQLDQLTAQISSLHEENSQVRQLLRERQQLEEQLEEHRAMAAEITDLMRQLQHSQNKKLTMDDSGNFSIQNMKVLPTGTCDGDGQHINSNDNNNTERDSALAAGGAVSGDTNNNGLSCEAGTNMMGELRNLFTNMDGEIQRLRYDLKQRDSDDRTYQNLHDELKVLMEKVEMGVRCNQELECLVSQLEDDKRTLTCKLDELMHKMSERDRQITMMDTRLNERNHQVVCLQEDANNKANRILCLEREIECTQRKSRVAESDGNQTAEQLKAAECRMKELEDIVAMKECCIADLQEEINRLQKEVRCIQQKADKRAECLSEQVYEYQKTADQLTCDNETLRQKLAVLTKSSDECKRTLRSREDQCRCLEAQVDELRMTLDEKDKLHNKVVESYQAKICKANEQIKNLECALMMCKNEVQMHLETMDKIRNHFECELTNRDQCIKQLKDELRKASEELKCRNEENCNLEAANQDLNNKLQNAYCSLKSCEQNVCCLTEKLKAVENQMLKDKACFLKETEELERRLSQALNNLACAQEEINRLKNCLAEKSAQVDCLQADKNSLCRDLAKCKEVACTLQEKLNKMEKDNQELCRQLQCKMDCVREVENAVCNKDAELKCCQRCVDELQEKLKLLSEAEVREKCEEIRSLNCTIEELTCKLHERIARVDELEKLVECLNKDIEKRMKRVDEQLKKYECELCEKAKQIADLDDCLSRCQHNLNEKCNELCCAEQKITRVCGDLQAVQIKLQEVEEAKECLCKALAEQKAENAELAQELRVTREQLQQKHQELVDVQQCLCAANRDNDRLRRECDDLRSIVSQRECEIQHLQEEKNCLVSKVAHLTCRLENETCQLQNQMAEMKCRFEKEIEALRMYQTEMEENNTCLMQKLGTAQRQLANLEKSTHQKLDTMNREIEDLTSRLADRDDQLLQCKECVQLKDAEIMRLKLRLCSSDNDPSNCSQPGMRPHYRGMNNSNTSAEKTSRKSTAPSREGSHVGLDKTPKSVKSISNNNISKNNKNNSNSNSNNNNNNNNSASSSHSNEDCAMESSSPVETDSRTNLLGDDEHSPRNSIG